MLDNRIKGLLEKEILTSGELEELMWSDNILKWENCGSSGRHIGYAWYSMQAIDGNEYSVYH